MDFTLIDFVLFALSGLGVGVLVGATGVGGGVLMTPLLTSTWGFGLPIQQAIGTDLLFAAGTKSVGTMLHGALGSVYWRIVGWMALGSVPTCLLVYSWLRTNELNQQTQAIMQYALVAAIIITAVGIVFGQAIKSFASRYGKQRDQQKVAEGSVVVDASSVSTVGSSSAWRAPLFTAIGGMAVGGLVMLTSVGGGVIGTTVLLALYPRLKTVEIVGTDIAHAVIITAVAGFLHAELGTTRWDVLVALLFGSIPGIYLGTKLTRFIPEHLFRPILAILLIILAVIMLLTFDVH